MTAGAELQAAIVKATLDINGLKGVFEGPPARAEYPYLVIDCGTEKDWSCGSREGREVTVILTLWDEEGARLLETEHALRERAIASRVLNGWNLSSLVLGETKRVRSAEGPWAAHIRLRARLLKTMEEGQNADA
jgi:hypothetical protein